MSDVMIYVPVAEGVPPLQRTAKSGTLPGTAILRSCPCAKEGNGWEFRDNDSGELPFGALE